MLVLILLLATLLDGWKQRIPNWLTLTGTLAGLLMCWQDEATAGLLRGLGGLAVGFLLLLPLYLMRGMAAGDVKLLMTAGVYLGPEDTLLAGLLSLIIGGTVALGYFVLHGQLMDCVRRWLLMMHRFIVEHRVQYIAPENGALAARSLPFAFAISTSCLLVVLLPGQVF